MTIKASLSRRRGWAPDDPRRRKVAAGKDRILDAALGVFLREGFTGASIEKVAATARISKMTLYRHFESKESLFLATINRRCAEIYDVDMHPPAPTRGDARRALRDFGWTFVNTIIADDVLALWRMLVGEASRFPEIGSRFYDAGPARTIDVISSILGGIMPREDARARAAAFMHLLMGDTHQRLLLHKCERADAMTDFRAQTDLAVDLIVPP